MFIPELAESEDERIRKIIRLALIASEDELSDFYKVHNIRRKECTDWLEKQKEKIEKEYVFRPLAGTDIKIAAEQAIRRAMKGDRLVLAFNGWYIRVDKYATTEGLVDGYYAFIEKQKEQKQYDIDVLERHITKDSVSELAHTVIVRNGWEIVEAKEQKPMDLRVKGDGVYKICPHCKERMIRDDSKVPTSMPLQHGYRCPKCGALEFDTVMYDSPAKEEQKPAEWGKEDKEKLNLVIDCIYDFYPGPMVKYELKDWLKSLPERFNLQPKQVWSEEDERILTGIIERGSSQIPPYEPALNEEQMEWLMKRLKSLRPQPKQEWSEEDEKIIRFYEADYNNQIGDMSMKDVIDMRLEFKNWLANRLKLLRPQSKEELAKMLQDEYNKGKEYGERIGYTKGYNKGYKEAQEPASYHFPIMPTQSSGFGCDGTHCTNPYRDCINCPIKSTGGISNTALNSGYLTLKAGWKPSEEQMKALHAASGVASMGEYVQRHLWSLHQDLQKLCNE